MNCGTDCSEIRSWKSSVANLTTASPEVKHTSINRTAGVSSIGYRRPVPTSLTSDLNPSLLSNSSARSQQTQVCIIFPTVAVMSMIAPTSSLLKYDNPALVSKAADKRTKVKLVAKSSISLGSSPSLAAGMLVMQYTQYMGLEPRLIQHSSAIKRWW